MVCRSWSAPATIWTRVRRLGQGTAHFFRARYPPRPDGPSPGRLLFSKQSERSDAILFCDRIVVDTHEDYPQIDRFSRRTGV